MIFQGLRLSSEIAALFRPTSTDLNIQRDAGLDNLHRSLPTNVGTFTKNYHQVGCCNKHFVALTTFWLSETNICADFLPTGWRLRLVTVSLKLSVNMEVIFTRSCVRHQELS